VEFGGEEAHVPQTVKLYFCQPSSYAFARADGSKFSARDLLLPALDGQPALRSAAKELGGFVRRAVR
jgi:hypothetical protein